MSKFRIVAFVALPSLRLLAEILKGKDPNDTGVDDELAAAINLVVDRLTVYIAQGEPVI